MNFLTHWWWSLSRFHHSGPVSADTSPAPYGNRDPPTSKSPLAQTPSPSVAWSPNTPSFNGSGSSVLLGELSKSAPGAREAQIAVIEHTGSPAYFRAVTVISIRAVPTNFAIPTVVRAGRGSLKYVM